MTTKQINTNKLPSRKQFTGKQPRKQPSNK